MLRFCSAMLMLAMVSEGAAPKRSNLIKYLPPGAFPELSSGIVRELESRKCLVPQYPKTWKAPDRINVIRGEFAKAGQKDWAVLCSTPGEVSLLVFWNASDKGFAEFPLTAPDGYILSGSLPKETLVEKYKADMPAGVVLNHEAIGITGSDNRTTVHYFNEGKWVQLGGVPRL